MTEALKNLILEVPITGLCCKFEGSGLQLLVYSVTQEGKNRLPE